MSDITKLTTHALSDLLREYPDIPVAVALVGGISDEQVGPYRDLRLEVNFDAIGRVLAIVGYEMDTPETYTTLDPEDIPADFEVRPLGPDDPATDRATCGTCGLSWDDAISTSYTPAPSARCPFEYFHESE